MQKFRVACFNVENLFSRPRLFAAGDDPGAAAAFRAAAVLQRLLDAKTYNADEIVRTYNDGKLGAYLAVQCDRVNAPDARSQRFFFHERDGDDGSPALSVNSAIHGRADWIGGIQLKGETLMGAQVQAIGKVIRRVDADVIGLCEVEDRRTLEAFNAQYLGRKYPYAVLFEGNDERGIDVALLSKHPVEALRSNAFTVDPAEKARRDGTTPRLFNRDCIEVAIDLPGGRGPLAVLVTHLKSKRGTDGLEMETDRKRLRQSAEIARILRERYAVAGKPHRVIVCGDLNESPDRNGANGAALGPYKSSIDPLLTEAGLANIVGDTLGPDKAFTHAEERRGDIARSQIDYILVSPDLKAAAASCGIDRSGQAHWGPKAVPRAQAASDHACLFVDFDLGKLN
jgi:endonuclease/exonuclease/phosphatase family metal-dependent hydrolase